MTKDDPAKEVEGLLSRYPKEFKKLFHIQVTPFGKLKAVRSIVAKEIERDRRERSDDA